MKSSSLEGEVGMQIVNKKGAAVDIWALQNVENPFGDELRRRTLGLESEEELLGFMRDLGGQWGSRRKKRKIVDASEFGDALPLGWKLLLGLKRKEGRAWIYCRRYVRYRFLSHLCKNLNKLASMFHFNFYFCFCKSDLCYIIFMYTIYININTWNRASMFHWEVVRSKCTGKLASLASRIISPA